MSARLACLGVKPELLLQRLCHINAAAHHHHINVVGGAFEEYIAYISAHKIALYMHLVGHFAYLMKYLLVEYLCQFGITV